MAYLDTSLLAAYYCPEPLSEAAQRVVMETPEPTVSRLVEVELYSAVAMKVRMGGLDTRSAGRITSLFQAHLAGGSYRVVPLDAREFAVARDWLGRFAPPCGPWMPSTWPRPSPTTSPSSPPTGTWPRRLPCWESTTA